MGEFGMRWRISVCLHFNTQGTVIDMVQWLSQERMVKKFRESRHTDKETIIEKFIQTDLCSRLRSKFTASH